MNDLYLVFWWDGFCDSSDYLDCIFLTEKEALNYVTNYSLNHEEQISVEQREVGVKRTYKNCRIIYQRTHYNHTEALFRELCYTYDCDHILSYDEVIASAINNYSPMCVNIDWDELYTLYLQYYDPDDE